MAPPMDLYEELLEIERRPAPFEEYTAHDLWTDEHTSARMLELHLDGTIDVSSRRTDFIDASAAWIARRFGLGGGRRVVDLGCGPGLYTRRFAATGADVTGVDFSLRSLAHARESARAAGLAIDYVHADYLQLALEKRFDLVTLIMCDFCALGPLQRARLLEACHALLAPGGALLLDVYSLAAFDAKSEGSTLTRELAGGFWSAAPHFVFQTTFKYDVEKVALDKYTVVEAARRRVVYNWLQHFSPESLRAEIEAHGLDVEELLGDVAGAVYDPGGPELALVGRKPSR